jgi:hypothetical protein
MADKNAVAAAAVLDRGQGRETKEPCCIHTKKIYDACRDKDCIEDIRVYLTRCGQHIVDRSINVKCRKAELIWVFVDVEAVSFNRGFYTVDVKYFYRITADAFTGIGRPTEVEGLATFDKRVILFGSEGNAKIYSSRASLGEADEQMMRQANMPIAVVEVVDPICLNVKLVDHCDRDLCDIAFEAPENICRCFDDELVMGGGGKRLYCTLGQFSLIRLERDSQLLINCIDFCMPEKECIGSTDDSPCDLFKRIRFPVDEFFPPDIKNSRFSDAPSHKDCCK